MEVGRREWVDGSGEKGGGRWERGDGVGDWSGEMGMGRREWAEGSGEMEGNGSA